MMPAAISAHTVAIANVPCRVDSHLRQSPPAGCLCVSSLSCSLLGQDGHALAERIRFAKRATATVAVRRVCVLDEVADHFRGSGRIVALSLAGVVETISLAFPSCDVERREPLDRLRFPFVF